MIPTVPGSEIDVSTPSTGARLSPGAFQNQGGREALAGAFGQVAGEANQLEGELIRAHEAGIAANVDLKMRTARQSFLDSLRNDSNEGWRGPRDSAWKDRAAELATQVHEDIFSAKEGITPEMQGQMKSAFDSWSTNLQIETQSAANVQMTNRAWGSTKQDYQEALRDDHADHAMNLLDNARRNNLADPVLIDQMERDIPRGVAANYINNGFASNPAGTYDLLKSGASLPAVDQNGKPIVPSKVFGTKEFEQLLNTARIRTESWQKNNAETMLLQDVDPMTGFVPEAVIRQKMASKEISEKFGLNQIKAQDEAVKRKTKEESEALHKKDQEAYSMIVARAHDSTAWGAEPDEYAHTLVGDAASISDPALKQKAINEANHQLKAVKSTGSTGGSDTQKRILELMNKDLNEQGAMIPVAVQDVAGTPAVHHWFTKDEAAAPGTTIYRAIPGGLDALKKMKETGGDDPWPLPGFTKDEAVEAANVHSARLQTQMIDWFKTPEGQKATFDQANDHRMELEKPFVMDAVRASLTKKAPAVITSREQFKALPSGAPFIYNGQTGYAP